MGQIDFNFIFNAVIAGSAFVVAILTGWSFKRAHQYQLENAKAHRAYFAPGEEPGVFLYDEQSTFNNSLSIQVKNFGLNPASLIEIIILGVGKIEGDKNAAKFEIIFNLPHTNSNPIAKGSCLSLFWTSKELDKRNIHELDFALTHHIILLIKYYDAILDKKYYDQFYWSIVGGGVFKSMGSDLTEEINKINVVKNFINKGILP